MDNVAGREDAEGQVPNQALSTRYVYLGELRTVRKYMSHDLQHGKFALRDREARRRGFCMAEA
jgi:hypothetical protein